MYRVAWDPILNGVLLVNGNKDCKAVAPPRPVFHEELDLMGFDNFWTYPRGDAPLLWAIGRKYYYKGELVAEAKGGNIYSPPQIVLTEKGQNLELEFIDIGAVVDKNKDALFVLENEAMDFVEHTYNVYRKKDSLFVVSYSGGKDSQVVLDIVTRVIPPSDLLVVFSDTTMEISHTYENVRKTKVDYERRFSGLKFYIAEPPKKAIDFWREFGPPSVKQRWCCTVVKTAPFHKILKEHILGGRDSEHGGYKKIVVFEGVRSDESSVRSKYERIRGNRKSFYQINAEVIHNWNSTEVFLYLFSRNLNINKGYRYGLDRVGCSVCPFASSWNESILYKIERRALVDFAEVIRDYGRSLGVSDKDISGFIADGQWKKRAGGRGVNTNGTALHFFFEGNKMVATLNKPRGDFLTWAKTIGDLHYRTESEAKIVGEIRIRSETLPFTIERDGKSEKISINTGNNPIIKELLKKVLYKSTYCVRCGACVEECPTGALIINSFISLDTSLCTHCANCLNFAEKGCLAAKSLSTYGGAKPMKTDRIATSKFQNFGLRREWLVFFLRNLDDWLSKNNLGNRQVDSLKTWLRSCELLERDKPADISRLLGKIIDVDESFVWAIVWTNLYHNENLIKWYLDTFDWGVTLSRKDLLGRLLQDDPNSKERTAKNTISSLFNLFDSSPIGQDFRLGLVEKRSAERYLKKIGTDDIHPLAIAYCLYRAAENLGRRDFTISELYSKEFKGGPYKLFGISRSKLEGVLRGLQEDRDGILRVDLVADLDNIYLRDDLSSSDILKLAEAKLR